jgi:endonuclease/exonuclease/phosphatase (EEP) superfamily protein YafD
MTLRTKGLVGVWGLLTAAGAVVCAATLLGFGGRFWWVFDLFSHFRVQYFLLLVLAALLTLPWKRFRFTLVFAGFAAVNLAGILPYYLSPNQKVANHSAVVRVLSINVNTANQNYGLVRDLVLENRPDLLLATEVNAAWIKGLEPISGDYPHRKFEAREDNFGIALYGKVFCADSRIVYLGEAEVPSIVAELQLDGRKLTLVGTHSLPPINELYSRQRNQQIDAVAQYMSTLAGPKMLIGDLNMSPWSCYFSGLLGSGLRDSAAGRGIQPTWPVHPVWLRIPIDFCLASDEVQIEERRIGPDVGSDHFPLIVDFSLKSTEPDE